MKTNTFIINLRSATSRHVAMEHSLRRFDNLRPVFIDAVDATKQSPAEWHKYLGSSGQIYRRCKRRVLSDGEVACALSHLSCLRTISNSPASCGLVLEDDSLLDDSFGADVFDASRFLENQTRPCAVMFSARTWVFGTPVRWQGRKQILPAWNAIGAYAYAINKSGADLVLAKTLPLQAPFDNWFLHYRNGLRLFSIVPHSASFIGNDDDSSLRKDRENLWENAKRETRKQSRLAQWLDTIFNEERLYRTTMKVLRRGRFETKRWPLP